MTRRVLIGLAALALGAGAAQAVNAAGATARQLLFISCHWHHRRRICRLVAHAHSSTTTATTTSAQTSPPGGPPTQTTPTGPAPLPSRLEVDEQEWSVVPTHDPVAAGTVQFNVANYGQDQHDLAVVAPDGQIVAQTGLIDPQGTATLTASLAPGTYTLECTLFGHHEHYSLGMHATLVVA